MTSAAYRADLPGAVVVDMDAPLCDVREIRHFVKKPPNGGSLHPHFATFHSGSLECPPFPEVVQLLRQWRDHGHLILVVSAREARWTFLTALWIYQHAIAYDETFQRANGGYRPDAVIKRDIAERSIRRFRLPPRTDDREDTIDVWLYCNIPTATFSENGSGIKHGKELVFLLRNEPGEGPGGV